MHEFDESASSACRDAVHERAILLQSVSVCVCACARVSAIYERTPSLACTTEHVRNACGYIYAARMLAFAQRPTFSLFVDGLMRKHLFACVWFFCCGCRLHILLNYIRTHAPHAQKPVNHAHAYALAADKHTPGFYMGYCFALPCVRSIQLKTACVRASFLTSPRNVPAKRMPWRFLAKQKPGILYKL